MTENAYESAGDVAVLTLSNPPANLFTLEVGEDIRSGVERAKKERARAMVIQADGAVFSGGADVSCAPNRFPCKAERFGPIGLPAPFA